MKRFSTSTTMPSSLSTGFASVGCGGGGARRVWSWRVGRSVWILPTIALPQGVCLAVEIDCQLLISQPFADHLFPRLDHLLVAHILGLFL